MGCRERASVLARLRGILVSGVRVSGNWVAGVSVSVSASASSSEMFPRRSSRASSMVWCACCGLSCSEVSLLLLKTFSGREASFSLPALSWSRVRGRKPGLTSLKGSPITAMCVSVPSGCFAIR